MQRISSLDVRIRPLGELLSPRSATPVGNAAEGMPEQPAEDPGIVLEQERMRIFENAWNEGFASGMTEAAEQIEARGKAAEQAWRTRYEQETERLKTEATALTSLREALSGAIASLERQVEPMVIETVFAAVRRIVGVALNDEGFALALCRQALEEYPLRPVVLRVARGDLETVKTAMECADVRIEADPALRSGQCRLESAKGLYEVSVEQRLHALQTALVGTAGEAEAAT